MIPLRWQLISSQFSSFTLCTLLATTDLPSVPPIVYHIFFISNYILALIRHKYLLTLLAYFVNVVSPVLPSPLPTVRGLTIFHEILIVRDPTLSVELHCEIHSAFRFRQLIASPHCKTTRHSIGRHLMKGPGKGKRDSVTLLAQIDVTSSRSFIRPGTPCAAVKISDNSFIETFTENLLKKLRLFCRLV